MDNPSATLEAARTVELTTSVPFIAYEVLSDEEKRDIYNKYGHVSRRRTLVPIYVHRDKG